MYFDVVGNPSFIFQVMDFLKIKVRRYLAIAATLISAPYVTWSLNYSLSLLLLIDDNITKRPAEHLNAEHKPYETFFKKNIIAVWTVIVINSNDI